MMDDDGKGRLLDLSRNQVETYDFERNPSLHEYTTVDLSHNRLDAIPQSVIRHMPHITCLNISHNDKIRLDDEQFMNELSAFKQLNSLFVDIPVREVNMQLLTKQLLECVPSLTELNGVPILSNNQLTIRTMNSNRSKLVIRTANDVLEVVFAYYQHLHKQLTVAIKSENEDTDTLITFSNYYQGLKHSLKLQLNTSLKYKQIIRQAKQSLFTTYYRELITFHQRKQNNEMVQQLQIMFDSYITVFKEYNFQFDKQNSTTSSSGTPSNLSQFLETDLIVNNNNWDSVFPVSSPYQRKPEEETDTLLEKTSDHTPDPLYLRIIGFLGMLLPWLVWFPKYIRKLGNIKQDLIAGITVGVMVIPQGMSYSLIAGLPPVYGLYTALIPLFVYSFFGTSMQLAVGPSAMSSLLLASGLQQLSVRLDAGSDVYIAFALVFSLVGGALQIVLGILRLGFLINFLSHPVLSGFTSAAAVIIACSQLNHFFGIYLPKDTRLHWTIINVAQHIYQVHMPTVAFGMACLAFLFFLDKFNLMLPKDIKFNVFGRSIKIPRKIHLKWIPANLVLVFTAIFCTFILQRITQYDPSANEVHGIKIAGSVPSGFPHPSIPKPSNFSLELFREVFILCLPVCLVGFMESIGVAKHFALQNNYEIDANQELIAIGFANLLGGFFRAFPSTGSISRTAVNANSGAVSPLANVVSGVVVMLALWIFTPFFYYIPMVSLAAIIIYACTKIPDYETVVFTYHTKKTDCLLLLLAFVCTLFIGITEGILIAAVTSLALVVLQSSRPRFSRVGRIPGTTAYDDIQKWKESKEIPHVLILRFDADIYFANIAYLKDKLKGFVKNSDRKIYAVVLDCSSINYIDSSALKCFKELQSDLGDHVNIYFAQMKKSLMTMMRQGHVYIAENFYVQLHDAVLHAESLVETKKKMEKITREITLDGDKSVSTYSAEEYEELI